MANPALQPLTFDAVEALEDRDGLRYELWHSEPVAMTGGTSAHNLIALALHRVLDDQLKLPCVAYAADMALKLQPGAYSDKAYLDGMVVCEPLPGNYQTAPVLVAEVLSESTVKRDRGDKWLAYTALPSLEVYLIISQTAAHVEVYRRATGWKREDYLGVEAVIELPQPVLTIPLAKLYAKVLALGLLGLERSA
jgi:Uma2 family endonuclease